MDVVDGNVNPDDRTGRNAPMRSFAHYGETFHQILMEDFRFLEAARLQSGDYEGAALTTEDLKPISKVKQLMVTNSQSLVNFPSYADKTDIVTDGEKNYVVVSDFRSRRFVTRMSKWPPVPIFAHWLLGTRNFQITMIIIIILNSFLMAIDGELSDETDRDARIFLDTLDFLFLSVFIAEILLKWIDNFTLFWYDYWNVFDFAVTAMSVAGTLIDILYQDVSDDSELDTAFKVVKYIRILRILRSLNVVTRIEKIMIIWAAIARTAKSLVFITILMFIFFFIFAVIGLELFREFTLSHRTDLLYHECFATLPDAMVTLFQLFTLDHWYIIIVTLSSGMTYKFIPIIYCLTWILLGSFIFRNIFVGVMVNNFQNIRQEVEMEEELVTVVDEGRLDDMESNIFALHDNQGRLRAGKDPLTDWEDEVLHNLDIIRLCEPLRLTPSMWPRDTLFLYYVLIESLAWNIDERDLLFEYISACVTDCYDR